MGTCLNLVEPQVDRSSPLSPDVLSECSPRRQDKSEGAVPHPTTPICIPTASKTCQTLPNFVQMRLASTKKISKDEELTRRQQIPFGVDPRPRCAGGHVRPSVPLPPGPSGLSSLPSISRAHRGRFYMECAFQERALGPHLDAQTSDLR